MLNAAHPFAIQQQYTISVLCNHFIQGLDCTLMPAFHQYYPMHSTIHNLLGSYQCQQLPFILAAAQSAEDKCKHIQEVAWGMLQSHGFFLQGIGSAGTLASQAENTIAKYKDRPPTKLNCWGCGGNHSWMKAGKIICPHGTEPIVIKTTKEKCKAYRKMHGNKNSKQKKGGRCKFVEFHDLDETSQKKYCKTVLAMSATDGASTSSTTSLVTTSTTSVGSAQIFMLSFPVPVFSMTPPSCCVFPIPIQAAFPHIKLQLGSALGCINCPAIWCVVDTAAALATGNLHFFTAVAKAYPHTVASIHSPHDYSPITLSGIVQQGGQSIMMDLTVGFQFHLPYLTCEGTATSLVLATGCNVMVNIILGLPFITQTKMVIDTANQVAEMRALDSPPFAINFRCAMCKVPAVNDKIAASNAAKFANIVKEAKGIKAFFAAKTAVHYACKSPAFLPPSILMLAKWAKSSVKFNNISNNSNTSTVSVGSTIDHSTDVEADAGAYSFSNLPDSA
jgi:hypothetical protein